MYEGLANILAMKGMGMTEDNMGFQRAFRLADMIPIVAAQAMPKQSMRPMPLPPKMSAPVYRNDGGKLVDGGKVDGDDYVVDAYTVAAIGNGSSDAGGKILDEALPKVENTDGSKTGMVQEEIGDGMSDNISYEVSNGGDIAEAHISQDEYIIDANQVKEIGDGNVDKGTERLDKLREIIRQQAYGTKEQPKEISAAKTLREFMKEA